MLVNADFSRRVTVRPDQYEWVDSNQPGIRRMMLDRIGGEAARATTLVRYAKGSQFPHHIHPGGEEILVLKGTFSEDNSRYPAGWYLRNPPGSNHHPFSPDGAMIFVKLRQMHASEKLPLRIDTNDPSLWTDDEDGTKCLLFSNHSEQVWLQRLLPGLSLDTSKMLGIELLVLDGEVQMESGVYPAGSWIRLPVEDRPLITAGDMATTLYVKTNHLEVVP